MRAGSSMNPRAALPTALSLFFILFAGLSAGCSQNVIRSPEDAATAILGARDAFDAMPSEQQIAEIGNDDVRLAATHTRQSLGHFTAVSPDDVSAIATLYSTFVIFADELDDASDARTCTGKCNADRDDCLEDCKNKGRTFCGCRFHNAGCLISAWVKGTC